MDSHGMHGIRELCGAKSERLTTDQISLLKTGDFIIVTWDGGNGPHLYEIRNDLDPWALCRTTGATSVGELLKFNLPHYISRPNALAHAGKENKANDNA